MGYEIRTVRNVNIPSWKIAVKTLMVMLLKCFINKEILAANNNEVEWGNVVMDLLNINILKLNNHRQNVLWK